MAQLFSEYQKDLLSCVSYELPPALGELAQRLSSAVVDNVHFAPEGPELFSVKVCHDGVTPIRYDLWSALGAALGLAGGVVGANPFSAVMAVLVGLITLRGGRRRVSEGEGYLLLALHRLGGEATLETLGNTVRDMGFQITEGQIQEGLLGLAQLGAVSITADTAKLEERVIVRYAPLSSILKLPDK